ncbi:MAG: hemolysin family protein [Chloroflexi bacterium]|nr:hemolysin family protein [Chloroflexota bacterium]
MAVSHLALNLLFLALALAIAAFFASAETAFVSLQRVRVRQLVDERVPGAERVSRLVEQPDKLLPAILLCSNLATTAAAAIGTIIASDYFSGGSAILVATIGVTVLLVVFGEITPKTIASAHSERFALAFAPIIELIVLILRPLLVILRWISTGIARLFRISAMPRWLIGQQEVETTIALAEEHGTLGVEEARMLRNILELEETAVREVMVPRTQVTGVSEDVTVERLAADIRQSGFTRLPVYRGTIDDLVGVVNAKDVLVQYALGHRTTKAEQIMRPIIVVPETKRVSDLLREMREQSTQIAAVIDEYGGTAGIVTIEDLLEEVVGEIMSEFGAERRLIHSISPQTVVVDASISINDFNELFGVELPSEEVDTLGGFVFQQTDTIPKAGDGFRWQHLEVTVLSMRGNRIGLVQVTKLSP